MLRLTYYEHTSDRNQLIIAIADNEGLGQLCEDIAQFKLLVFLRQSQAVVSIADRWNGEPDSVALTITPSLFEEITARCDSLFFRKAPVKSYINLSAGFSLCLYKPQQLI
jgi:hypothetical protein